MKFDDLFVDWLDTCYRNGELDLDELEQVAHNEEEAYQLFRECQQWERAMFGEIASNHAKRLFNKLSKELTESK